MRRTGRCTPARQSHLVSTFGVPGGLLAGTPGQVAPQKLFAFCGAGVDVQGNLYIGMSYGAGPNGNFVLRAKNLLYRWRPGAESQEQQTRMSPSGIAPSQNDHGDWADAKRIGKMTNKTAETVEPQPTKRTGP